MLDSDTPSFSMPIRNLTTTARAVTLRCPRMLTFKAGIRAFPNSSSSNADALTFEGGLNSAILRYDGAHDCEPRTCNKTATSVLPLVETNLHPLVPTPPPGELYPGGANVTLALNISLVSVKGLWTQPQGG